MGHSIIKRMEEGLESTMDSVKDQPVIKEGLQEHAVVWKTSKEVYKGKGIINCVKWY